MVNADLELVSHVYSGGGQISGSARRGVVPMYPGENGRNHWIVEADYRGARGGSGFRGAILRFHKPVAARDRGKSSLLSLHQLGGKQVDLGGKSAQPRI